MDDKKPNDNPADPKDDCSCAGQNPYWPGQGAKKPGKLPGKVRTEGAEEETIIPIVDSVPGKQP